MKQLWPKIKLTLVGILLLYFILVLALNWSAKVTPSVSLLFYTWPEPNLLLVVLVVVLSTLILSWLARTVYRTMGQIRARGDRNRTEKLSREIDEMRAKAATLQTKPPAAPAAEPPQA